jgi:cytoskeleton protein RodZ
MDSRIGSVFHEARNRRKIDLSEVEAATRIRVRYLRAIENEEWDVLPGGVYTRGFIRTYAGFLGLDGERLAEDYRKSVEGAQRGPAPESAAALGSPPPERRWPLPRGSWVAVAAVLLVAVIAIVAIPGGGSGGGGPASQRTPGQKRHQDKRQHSQKISRGVSVRLAASAEVWVCVLNAQGKPLVNGQILETGVEEGPFRSGSFTVSFGNGEVSMLIDGREADIPATSSPIGYSIDSSGSLTELTETERPTCT